MSWPLVPTFQFCASTDGLRFKQIVSRLRFSLALTVDGHLYSWGSTWFGTLALGKPRSTEAVSSPSKVSFFEGLKVSFIAASDFHAAAVTETGDLFLWGSNTSGQLGMPLGKMLSSEVPVRLEWFRQRNIRIRKVGCAQQHTVAVADDGEVYAWGDNRQGYLGLGVDISATLKEILTVPCCIEVLRGRGAIYATCGNFHSCVLTEGGELFTWGAGEAGQLGHNECRDVLYPRVVRGVAGRPVAFVAAGNHCTAIITSEGKMYSWGNNAFGRLGLANDGADLVRLPTLCRTLAAKPLRMVSLGAFHGAAVTRAGDLYTWGLHEHSALGRDGAITFQKPVVVKLNGIKVSAVSCGWIHTCMLTLPQKSQHLLDRTAVEDGESMSAFTRGGASSTQQNVVPQLRSHAATIPKSPEDQLSELQQQMALLQKQIRDAMVLRQQTSP